MKLLSPATLKRHWRELLLAALYGLPTLALVGLGGLWLWERGYLAAFTAVGLGAVLAAAAVRSFWRLPPHGIAIDPAEPGASQAEKDARAALDGILASVAASDVASPQAVQDLAERTVRAVAGAYHPGDGTPWLNVTVPELLLMAEDAAHRLREVLVRDVPVLRSFEIGLAVKAQKLVAGAGGAWNVYRVLRLANPISAITQELRSFIVNKAVGVVAAETKKLVAAVIVREVGETAIKLYSGGYRRSAAELAAVSRPTGGQPAPPPKPLTFLITGRPNAGKSSLLNALVGGTRVPAGHTLPTDTFWTLELDHPDAGMLVLVDSPGVSTEPTRIWLNKAREADLIIWTAAANKADRAADQKALRALRSFAIDDVKLRQTPIVLAATHADRLDPPMEWNPPYDPCEGGSVKERNMRDALAAVGTALDIPPGRRAIISVETTADAWNTEALWACILEALPEAQQKQLERGLQCDGWLKATVDLGRSVPGALKQVLELTRKWAGRLFSGRRIRPQFPPTTARRLES